MNYGEKPSKLGAPYRAFRFAEICGFALCLLAALLLLPAGTAWAQSRITGEISGTVVDPSGASVPHATVTATQPNTGFSQTVKASAAGVFVFPALQPGTYEMRATASGFATAVYSNVVVQTAQTTNVKVEMKIGSTAQTVTVSAQGQILKTTSATLATTLSPSAVQNLPLGGLNALPLAALAPGAVTAEGNQRYTTYNGLPAASINITVNGTNDNFQRYRTSTTGFFTAAPLRLGAFDEFTVSTSDLAAEAGAEGSSTVRFVTKHGTNQLHGNAFWYAENSYFNANDYLNNALGISKPSQHLNSFGGSIGGPVIKNKLFFFGYLEYRRNPTAFTSSSQVFTSDAQNGTFTYMGTNNQLQTVNLLNLAAQNNFPGSVNSISGGMLQQINSFVPHGTLSPGTYSTGATATPVTQTLSWLQPITYKNWWPTVRLDYNITPKLSWHGTWDSQWFTITATPNYPGASLAGGGWWSNYYTLTNSLDWTLASNVINQFSFGITETREEFNPATSGDPFASQADEVINPPLGVNPVIPGFILPIPRNNPVYNPTDNLTWTHGNHTFTFGGDVRIATMYETEINNPPTYNTGIVPQDPAAAMFSPSNFPYISTANGNAELNNAESLYAFLAGRLSGISGYNEVSTTTHQFQVEGAGIAREEQRVAGIYFQDAWRATPHLAFNYGFRWQFSGAVHSTNNFWTGPTLAGLYGPSSAEFQPGVLNGDFNPQIRPNPNPYSPDYIEPSPNFGVAWNPDFTKGMLHKIFGGSNTVFRAGAGITHYDEGWTTVENAMLYTNPGNTQSVFYYPSLNFTPGSLSLGQSITPEAFPATYGFPLPESAYTFAFQPFAAVDPNIRSPYVEQWNLGIQRKFPGNNLLEVDYVGNHGVHLWMSYDINEVNIFENGFLTDFNNAAKNLAINQAQGYGATFADNTGATGLTPTPIFDTAFTGQAASAGFANPSFVTLLQQGQAGALAGQLAGSYSYLCNLVGGDAYFTPCAGSGGTGTYPINMFQVNPFAAGQYLDLLSNPGDSTYNALQVQWQHPVGHGLMFMANYTWSHGLTNRWLGDYYTSDEALQNFTTLRNMSLNKGPSPYDVRQVFKLYTTYNLPFGRGQMFNAGNNIINNIIGGWNLGSIVTAESGLPFKILGGYNTYNYSYGYWPDAADAGVVLNGATVNQLQSNVGVYGGPTTSDPVVFLNPNLLANNPNAIASESTPGQLGSFIFLHGPGLFNADFSLNKTIPIYERLSMKIDAEFINAFNHPNWGVPGVHGNSPADYMNITGYQFTGATEVSSPRSVQFRLELDF